MLNQMTAKIKSGTATGSLPGFKCDGNKLYI